MEIFRVLGIGMTTALLANLIRRYRPEIAAVIPSLGAVAVFFCLLPYLQELLSAVSTFADRAGLEREYFHGMLKMIGVAYLCRFSAELCRDAGEASVASRIEFAGKLMILFWSMPMAERLLRLVDAMICF